MTRASLSLFILLALATPANAQGSAPLPRSKWVRAGIVAMVAMDMTDAGVTLDVLRRVPGAYEKNPMLRGLSRHPAPFALTKAGIAGGKSGLALLLERRYRSKRLALFGIAINVAVSGYAVKHNLNLLRAARRP